MLLRREAREAVHSSALTKAEPNGNSCSTPRIRKRAAVTLQGEEQYPLQGRSLAVFRIRERDEADSLSAKQVETLIRDNRPLPPPQRPTRDGDTAVINGVPA